MSDSEIQFPQYEAPTPQQQRGIPVADRGQSRVLFKAIKHFANLRKTKGRSRKSLHRDDNVHIKRRKPIFY